MTQLPARSLAPDFSKMGQLLLEKDWSGTLLGPLETWPVALRTTVSIMLHAASPMFIAWGDSLIFLFNDAYCPILDRKSTSPAEAMGKPFAEVWPEIWPELEPLVGRALSGQGIWSQDRVRPVPSITGFQQSFYSFSYTPIIDDSGEARGIFGAIMETTDKVLATNRLIQANEQLQLAADAAELGFFDRDIPNNVINMDTRCRLNFGIPPNAMVDADTVFAAIHPDDLPIFRRRLERLMEDPTIERYEAEYRTISQPDGRQRWIAARGRMFFDAKGAPQHLIGFTMDITARKATEKREHEAAQHDSLTGLPNRALLFEYCELLLSAAERRKDTCAILFIDLDRFKPINDLHGHEVGDKVLQHIARRLKHCTRKEDIVSRLGGDEFIIVLPNVATSEDAERVARHILEEIGQPVEVGLLQLQVTPSIGISLFQHHAKDLDALIRCADLAMYAAKKEGRNTYHVYAPGLDNGPEAQLKIEVALQRTIASESLRLLFQPIIDLRSGRLAGAEALVRMPSAKGIMVSPLEFIPVAESTGMINQIGEWVIQEVCRQHHRWIAAGLPPLSVAVNVSPVQFRQAGFTASIRKAVRSCIIDPHCLQIEVTESAVIDNFDEAMATLTELREMGLRICLDDFGTGYSSLSYLSNLPLDKLKIDQSFIRKMVRHEPTRAITQAIVTLGKSLNLQVVAEGIESAEALEQVRLIGCDEVQGFFFSAPLPGDEFEEWMKTYLQNSELGEKTPLDVKNGNF